MIRLLCRSLICFSDLFPTYQNDPTTRSLTGDALIRVRCFTTPTRKGTKRLTDVPACFRQGGFDFRNGSTSLTSQLLDEFYTGCKMRCTCVEKGTRQVLQGKAPQSHCIR